VNDLISLSLLLFY